MIDNEAKKPNLPYENEEKDQSISDILLKFKSSTYSNEEINIRAEVDKVIYVLNRCLAKLEVLAKLPYFLENDGENLIKYLKRFDSFSAIDVFNLYGARFTNELYDDLDYKDYVETLKSLLLDTSNKDVSKFDNTLCIDPQVYQLIDMLFYNKCIKAVIHSSRNIKVDSNVMKLIKTFREFRNILKEKMYVSDDKRIENEKKLRSAYKTSILQTAAIKELQDQFEKQRKELGDQLRNKVEIFEMYEMKIKKIQNDFQEHIAAELHESEKSMMHASLNSEQLQIDLAEEAKKLTREYELLLEEHLAKEKFSRTKRMKLEAQLQNWLTTFDQDIGEKQSEYEVLHKEYTENQTELENLHHKIIQQEEEYNILMEEKRIEEERIFNEMAYQFLMNRCARTIQRYWRSYWERRQSRRKGKRRKGKGDKGKTRSPKPAVTRTTDVTAALASDKKIKGHVFEEFRQDDSEVFKKTE